MSRDPLGPRNLAGLGANIVLGALVVVVGLVLALSNGGWVWLLPLIGAVLIGVCLAELYLDPVDRPRRGIRGALRQHRQRRPWRSR